MYDEEMEDDVKAFMDYIQSVRESNPDTKKTIVGNPARIKDAIEVKRIIESVASELPVEPLSIKMSWMSDTSIMITILTEDFSISSDEMKSIMDKTVGVWISLTDEKKIAIKFILDKAAIVFRENN